MNLYDYESLKSAADKAGVWIDVQDDKVRRGRGTGNTNIKERVSRALSWYAKSEFVEGADERLIFAFVAFNALYAQDKKNANGNDSEYRSEFIGALANSEHAQIIVEFAHSRIDDLRKILSLQHLSGKYWNHTSDMNKAREILQKEKQKAHRVKKGDIAPRQLYVVERAISKVVLLRNQIMHGMAAYADSYNRTQVKLCADFLRDFTGCAIAVVIRDSLPKKWGKVSYPPQGAPDVSPAKVEELED